MFRVRDGKTGVVVECDTASEAKEMVRAVAGVSRADVADAATKIARAVVRTRGSSPHKGKLRGRGVLAAREFFLDVMEHGHIEVPVWLKAHGMNSERGYPPIMSSVMRALPGTQAMLRDGFHVVRGRDEAGALRTVAHCDSAKILTAVVEQINGWLGERGIAVSTSEVTNE